MKDRKGSVEAALLALALLAISTVVAKPVDVRTKLIDEYIRSLKYDRNKVFEYKGETLKGVAKTGTLDESRVFNIVERSKQNYHNNKPDIGVIASNEHESYPGNLFLANNRLLNNAPDILVVDRAPVTYTVNLPGLTTDGSFTIIPSFQEYQSSLNKVLNKWFEKEDHEVNANFQSVHSLAYSKELLRVKFGLEFRYSDIESSIDFGLMNAQKKLIMVHKFKQIYYTVSVEPTIRPSNLFGPNVTVDELRRKTNDANPPVMVDSVSYGRIIYVKLETMSTDKDAKFILENKLLRFGINSHIEMEDAKNLKNLTLTVFVIGGSSGNIDLVNADTLQEINDIIIKYGKFSQTNLGFPISYSTQFIKDNTRGVINSQTEYIETTRIAIPSGTITVIHHGWYFARWNITWTEIQFDENGERIDTPRGWDKNGLILPAPFKEEIEMPGNAVDIRVAATAYPLLPWRLRQKILERGGIPLIKHREFKIWGMSFDPVYSIDPELENS